MNHGELTAQAISASTQPWKVKNKKSKQQFDLQHVIIADSISDIAFLMTLRLW